MLGWLIRNGLSAKTTAGEPLEVYETEPLGSI